MEIEALKIWTEIYDTTILESYKNERKELQKTAMLITALQTEIRNVEQIFEKELLLLRERLKEKDEIEEKVHSLPAENNCVQNSNKNGNFNELDTIQNSDTDTPDIFANTPTNTSSNSEVVDLTSGEDITSLETSPSLISKRKNKSKKHTKICDGLKKNIFKVVDKENSILVDSTPDIQIKRRTTNKSSFLSKKKKNISTLTQMFLDTSKNTTKNQLKPSSDDTTYLKEDDTTYLKKDTSELGITRLLSYVNQDENENPIKNDNSIEDEMDSTQDVDEFSKGILFDEESPIPVSPKKKFKPCDSLVEPGLRGHAKKMLKGFSCAQCRYFYGSMKLSPEELQKKIDECSNHRYKYQPPEDTYEGIWDLTIPAEKVQKK